MKQGDVIQFAHVVHDLECTMVRYWEELGIGPWDIYTFAPPSLRESVVRGKPSEHTYRIALTWLNEVQIELIQPLEGRSIYDEHLERRGEGIHHVKLFQPNCTKALAGFTSMGFAVLQSGKFDEEEFYYLDTERAYGYVIEIGNNGKLRRPERRFPR